MCMSFVRILTYSFLFVSTVSAAPAYADPKDLPLPGGTLACSLNGERREITKIRLGEKSFRCSIPYRGGDESFKWARDCLNENIDLVELTQKKAARRIKIALRREGTYPLNAGFKYGLAVLLEGLFTIAKDQLIDCETGKLRECKDGEDTYACFDPDFLFNLFEQREIK